jgi:hypothetical protein
MELKQGMITWATTLLPNDNRKRRPVVIVPPTALIANLEKIWIVGISTSFHPNDPDIIPLPWRTDGNICTGLKRQSAITLALQDILDKELLTPTTHWIGKAAMIEMIERLKSMGD